LKSFPKKEEKGKEELAEKRKKNKKHCKTWKWGVWRAKEKKKKGTGKSSETCWHPKRTQVSGKAHREQGWSKIKRKIICKGEGKSTRQWGHKGQENIAVRNHPQTLEKSFRCFTGLPNPVNGFRREVKGCRMVNKKVRERGGGGLQNDLPENGLSKKELCFVEKQEGGKQSTKSGEKKKEKENVGRGNNFQADNSIK